MSKIKFQVNKPDDIEFTLTATFTLARWRELYDQLRSSPYTYPGSELVDAIRDCAIQAGKTFVPEEPTQS